MICHLNLSRYYNASEKQLEILIRKLAEVTGCTQRLFYRKKKDNRFKNNPKISPEMKMMFQMKMNMYEHLEHLVKESKVDVVEFEKLYILSIFKHEYIEKFKECNFIHAHDRKSSLIALYLYKKFNIKYAISYHIAEPPNKKLYQKIFFKYMREAFETAVTVVAVSNFVKNMLLKWNNKLNNIKVIYDTPSFLRSEINKAESNFHRSPFTHTAIIGMVGKHLLVKNFEIVADLALRYIKKAPDVQFILIGDGETDAILREKSRYLFNFKMHGYIINIEEHSDYFDALILPSKEEALGSLILDMMELGKPVIASNVGGIPELITHGENGYLFDPNSLDDLEKKVDALIGDPILIERLKQSKLPWLEPVKYGESLDFMKFVKAGKEKAKELSRDKYFNNYWEIYKDFELCDGKPMTMTKRHGEIDDSHKQDSGHH